MAFPCAEQVAVSDRQPEETGCAVTACGAGGRENGHAGQADDWKKETAIWEMFM